MEVMRERNDEIHDNAFAIIFLLLMLMYLLVALIPANTFWETQQMCINCIQFMDVYQGENQFWNKNDFFFFVHISVV